jgi:para-aminobenzoate synthetase component 1
VLVPRINLSTTPTGDPSWPTGFARVRCVVRCDAKTLKTTATIGASAFKSWDDPLEALAWVSRTFWDDDGRWVGYLGYDLGRLFEKLPTHAVDDLDVPLFALAYCQPQKERIYAPEPEYGASDAPLRSTFTRDAYERAVARSIAYVAAGDVFQVNLAQRFTVGLPAHPAQIYQRLVQQAPSAYGAYFGFGDFAIVSNSPELFLKVERNPETGKRHIVTRPIKGTRRVAPGMAEELEASAKDRAELNMIVDLERNDLGRVCEIGSVRVTEPRTIEHHPTVYHGVATIEGTLRDDVTFVDLLRGVFPGGSVTGAPKIRAMEIIDELEPVRRGPYCGAIGWLGRDGSMTFNVAIRSIVIKGGLAHVSVGGGIVADSVPADEYEETLVKARAIFDALGVSGPSPSGRG